jgi:hypothetical protein
VSKEKKEGEKNQNMSYEKNADVSAKTYVNVVGRPNNTERKKKK